MRLYQFPWGIYPRRVLIYLAEKGLSPELVNLDVVAGELKSESFLAKNPAGTVPLLEIGEGQFIRQSNAILEYLEELYPDPSFLGETKFERASTRDAVQVIYDVYSHFLFFAGHVSPVFAGRIEQSAVIARDMQGRYLSGLELLEEMFAFDPFVTGDRLTIADCILFASAQFAAEFYGVPIASERQKLCGYYEMFAARPSASVPEYPAEILKLATLPSEWR